MMMIRYQVVNLNKILQETVHGVHEILTLTNLRVDNGPYSLARVEITPKVFMNRTVLT
jgi:hypothetical protein